MHGVSDQALLGINREFKAADVVVGDELDVDASNYLAAKEIADATSLPIYLFRDQAERNRKCVPHLMLVGNLRFSLQAILEWEIANSVPGNAVSAVVREWMFRLQCQPSAGMSLFGDKAENGSIPRPPLTRCPLFWPKVHPFDHLSTLGGTRN